MSRSLSDVAVTPRVEPSESRSVPHISGLDGIRGIAVSAVVLFHAGIPGFEAGFLGVDLFFVLSGFLITTLLATEWSRRGCVSLGGFFSRRFKRLMPALIVMLVAVSAVSTFQVASVRASTEGDALSALFYVANWRFIATSSYFADNGVTSPLEHTWSLSIEEQFYFVWPLVLIALTALAGRRSLKLAFAVAVAGALASAAYEIAVFDAVEPTFSYMATQARAFEPLIGAAGALALICWPQIRFTSGQVRAVLAIVASLVLLSCLWFLQPDAAGVAVVYAHGGNVVFSLAALLLIMCVWIGPKDAATRWSRWRLLTALGLISYGVYLWHWPMLVWIADGGKGSLSARAIAIALALAAAIASYFFIELPVRVGGVGRWLGNGRRLFVAAAFTMAVTAALILLFAMPVGNALAAGRSSNEPLPDGQSAPAYSPHIVMVGDSVAQHLSHDVEAAVEDRGWPVSNAAIGGCAASGTRQPLTDGVQAEKVDCVAAVPSKQANALLGTDDVSVWMSRWELVPFDFEGRTLSPDSEEFWKVRQQSLDQVAQRLTASGGKLVLVGTERMGTGLYSRCSPTDCLASLAFRRDHPEVLQRWNSMLKQYAQAHSSDTIYVDLDSKVCHNNAVICDDSIDGIPARPDGVHYEGAGADLATRELIQAIGEATKLRG